ncbi:unnamed protein product, partial [Ectocarpus fasciculatus]
MRLRPGFLKPQASPRTISNASTLPTNDDGRGLDYGAAEAAGGGGGKRDSSRSSLPPRHGSCYGGGAGSGGGGNISGSDARTSSGTSQSSVGSLLSSRGNLSPTAGAGGGGEGPVAKLSIRGARGSGGSYRRRAASTPVQRSSGGHDRPPSRWSRRRRSDAIEPDDEELMERGRGDGNGVSDEEEEEEGVGVLGKPSEESWSEGLSADPLGVRRGGDFFPGDSPAVSPAAAHDGEGVAVVGGKDAAAAAAKRRHGGDRVGLKAPEASPDLERDTGESEGGDDDGRGGGGGGGGGGRWWSRRQTPEGAEGESEGRWWSPLHQPDDEDALAWWSGRRKSSVSTTGGGGASGASGEDSHRWSNASSLFSQAVSAFSAIGPAPPPAPPPAAVPSGSGVNTVAAQDAGGGGGDLAAAVSAAGAGGASAGCGVSGDGGVSAEPGTAADKLEGGVRGALVERPRTLLELPFFCKENGTEEMRVVLENADLRAGFKQAREREGELFFAFLAKRLCAENLVFVEDVMRYQEVVVGQDAEGVSGPVAALQLGGEIEEKYLSESSRLEV